MRDKLQDAVQEVKRADHLIFVSLKYTRTVDVIKSIVDRLINSFAAGFDSLLVYAVEKKMIDKYPPNPVEKCALAVKIFKDKPEMSEYAGFYLFLRKLSRAKYTRHREYRRHVTMEAVLEGKIHNIDIDTVESYYEKNKEFISFVGKIVLEKDD